MKYSKLIILSLFFLYLFNFALEILNYKNSYFTKNDLERQKFFKKEKKNYDFRPKHLVINSYLKKNQNVFPNIGAEFYFSKIKDGVKINSKYFFPLGGPGKTYFLMDNENGYFPLYLSDRYGFNNADEIYNKDLDIMIIGDHIAEGLSVEANENVGYLLNNNSNCNSANIGKYDNAALSKYASLVEYGSYYKPKTILWFHYPDDVHELKRELQIPILKKYITNANFSQNFISVQKKFDDEIINYLIQERENLKKRKGYISKKRIILLSNLKDLIFEKLNLNIINEVNIDEEKIIFEKIMLQTSELVKSWNGKVFFFYFPEYRFYKEGENYNFRGTNIFDLKNFVENTAKKNNFKVVDMQNYFSNNYKNPIDIYPIDVDSHFSPAGYKIISLEILKLLKNQEIRCINF